MAAVAAAAIFQVPVFNPCWMAGGAAAAASSSLEKKEAIHFQATIPSRPAKLLPLRLRPRLLAAAGAVVPITIWLLTSLYAPACAPGWNHSGFLFVEKSIVFFCSQNCFDKNCLTALASNVINQVRKMFSSHLKVPDVFAKLYLKTNFSG